MAAIPYNLGHQPEAALTILECEDWFRTHNYTLYLIEYDCCQRQVQMLHRGITRRIKLGLTLCKLCAHPGRRGQLEKAQELRAQYGGQISEDELQELIEIANERQAKRGPIKNYGFVAPPWPVPRIVVPMYLREREYYKTQC